MQRSDEWKILLAGPKLTVDEVLCKWLSVDYDLSFAGTLIEAAKRMEMGDVDIVLTEQQFADGRGVDFLKQMRANTKPILS